MVTIYERVNEDTGELVETDIESLKANDLRDILATDFSVTLPKSWTKAQILDLTREAISGNTEAYEGYVERPLDTLGTSKNPGELSVDQLKARVEQHRETVEKDEAERLRLQAEKSKPKRASWDPTPEELRKRTLKVGYAVGVLGWALNRLQKESSVMVQVVDGLGEGYDQETRDLAREGAVEGYAKAFDQFRFPSPACSSVDDAGLPARVWAELLGVANGYAVSQLLQELVPNSEDSAFLDMDEPTEVDEAEDSHQDEESSEEEGGEAENS